MYGIRKFWFITASVALFIVMCVWMFNLYQQSERIELESNRDSRMADYYSSESLAKSITELFSITRDDYADREEKFKPLLNPTIYTEYFSQGADVYPAVAVRYDITDIAGEIRLDGGYTFKVEVRADSGQKVLKSLFLVTVSGMRIEEIRSLGVI